MMRRPLQTTVAALSMLVLALPGLSSGAPAEAGLRFYQDLGASYNPLGLQLVTKVFYRVPLLKTPGILWESTKLDAGLINEWTPTDDFLGAFVNIEPIAVFDLTVRAGYYKMYRALGYGFYTLSGPEAAYDNETLESLTATSRSGWLLSAKPTLKAKLMNFIVANSCAVNRIDLGEGGYYLEQRSVTVHYLTDIDVGNDLYVLYEYSPRVTFGLTHHLTYVKSTEFLAHRLCGMLVYSPDFKGWPETFGVLQGGMHLKEKYYEGTFYVALLLGVNVKIPIPGVGTPKAQGGG